jgi:prepilin-type N-terminal cleavage/methylation domain-containing protein
MNKGFTLIEIMTSLSVFLVVMTMSMGSIVGIFEANRKAQSMRTVMGNLNLAVESMTKEIRFGRDYRCGTTGNGSYPNCSQGENEITFDFSRGNVVSTITYRHRGPGTPIERSINNGPFIATTAPEMFIEDLSFYTVGVGNTDQLQPKVLVKITGYSGTGKSRSDFTLQTLVSQRALDI